MENIVAVDRPLATVVKVTGISPIEGADRIVLAKVLGWKCIIKKEEFSVGDLAIYFTIDSVLDVTDKNMEFAKKFGGRIKTIKMKGVLSQGLLAPLSWISDRGHSIDNIKEDDDVTEKLNVKKYVHDTEIYQYIESKEKDCFPIYIKKTDEPRLQGLKNVLDELTKYKDTITITRKEDGQSGTFFYYNDKYCVCSRNFVWKTATNESMSYFNVSEKYKLEECLKDIYNKTSKHLAIQGEVIGPKINGNRLKLDQYVFRVFNIWDINEQKYIDWASVKEICSKYSLETVPELFLPESFEFTVDSFVDFANKQEYSKGNPAEGIVVKTAGDQRISFKVISNVFLLKHNL